MTAGVDELRPLRAGRLLTLRIQARQQTEDELERAALCNAQVLAECCYTGGKRTFSDGAAVLDGLTFPEMEELLTALGRTAAPGVVNPGFDNARYAALRRG